MTEWGPRGSHSHGVPKFMTPDNFRSPDQIFRDRPLLEPRTPEPESPRCRREVRACIWQLRGIKLARSVSPRDKFPEHIMVSQSISSVFPRDIFPPRTLISHSDMCFLGISVLPNTYDIPTPLQPCCQP